LFLTSIFSFASFGWMNGKRKIYKSCLNTHELWFCTCVNDEGSLANKPAVDLVKHRVKLCYRIAPVVMVSQDCERNQVPCLSTQS
jgi:hypothetical protein